MSLGPPFGIDEHPTMTPEERKTLMDTTSPEVDAVHDGMYVYFDWAWKGCGFGQLDVRLNGDRLEVANELMSRDRVRKILHAFADFVADRAHLDDNPDDVPPIDFAAERAAARKHWEEFNATRKLNNTIQPQDRNG